MAVASQTQKSPARARQSDAVLQAISARVEATIESLERAKSDPENIEMMRKVVENVADGVVIVSRSLEPLKDSAEKQVIVDRLQALESMMKAFEHSLPEDERPFFYDSGKDRIRSVVTFDLPLPGSICFGQPHPASRCVGANNAIARPSLQCYPRPRDKASKLHFRHDHPLDQIGDVAAH